MILVIILGALGFHVIEGWEIFDSLYMSLITVSTVGFQEVHPLSKPGRAFTALLIVSGVGVAYYTFVFLARIIVELRRIRIFRKMQKRIADFNNHAIVCGYGRLGQIVVRELRSYGRDVVVIETSPDSIAELDAADIPSVEGSAYEDETLKAAGIDRARHLLAMLPTDADNVYVTLCARDLNPTIHIIARTEARGGEKRLRLAGAHQVIAPYRVSGQSVVQSIIRPNVSEFLEVAGDRDGAQLVLEEIVVPSGSVFAGKTLEDSQLRLKTGVIIAAIIDEQHKMTLNPDRNSVIQSGATMIVLGEKASVAKLGDLLLTGKEGTSNGD